MPGRVDLFHVSIDRRCQRGISLVRNCGSAIPLPGIHATPFLWKHPMNCSLHLIHVFVVFLGGIAINLAANSDQAHAQGCCFGTSRAPAYPVGPPVPVNPTAPAGTAMNSYYGSYGMLPPSPGTLLPAGLPQTSAAFLPTAAYDTRWQQTPVTYYRPVTQYDPNYGTTVTSLQPCTSYQYQAARVPLVAPSTFGSPTYAVNRMPVTNMPAYYPQAGLPVGSVPMPSAYPTLQQLPTVGTPVIANRMNQASTGTSSGPSSTLPLATMAPPAGTVVTANHLAPMSMMTAPNAATQATAWMPATTVPMPQVPITSAIPGTGTPVYTVPATVPTTSLSPCPNGVCAPSIPGATSVIPLGPPTLMSPSSMSPSSPFPSTSSASTTPFLPSVTNPILPNPGDTNPVLPPSNNYDPEATRPPTLGNSAAMYPMKRIPVAEIDRGAPVPVRSAEPPAAQPIPQPENRALPSAPPVLPPSTLEPLKAPSDLDAKPRWNPKLLPRSNGESRETVASTPKHSSATV